MSYMWHVFGVLQFVCVPLFVFSLSFPASFSVLSLFAFLPCVPLCVLLCASPVCFPCPLGCLYDASIPFVRQSQKVVDCQSHMWDYALNETAHTVSHAL